MRGVDEHLAGLELCERRGGDGEAAFREGVGEGLGLGDDERGLGRAARPRDGVVHELAGVELREDVGVQEARVAEGDDAALTSMRSGDDGRRGGLALLACDHGKCRRTEHADVSRGTRTSDFLHALGERGEVGVCGAGRESEQGKQEGDEREWSADASVRSTVAGQVVAGFG